MRKPRIELGPTAWKAAILTIILFALGQQQQFRLNRFISSAELNLWFICLISIQTMRMYIEV